jgi:hypothetical protein
VDTVHPTSKSPAVQRLLQAEVRKPKSKSKTSDFPCPWHACKPLTFPERAATVADLESLLSEPSLDWSAASRFIATSCYALSGEEIERVIWFVIGVLRESPAMKKPCPQCGTTGLFRLCWQTFTNQTRHIRASCAACGAYHHYAEQTPENCTEADRNPVYSEPVTSTRKATLPGMEEDQ